MQQRAFRPFSLPLSPAGTAVSLLFASAAAWGTDAAAASTQLASVEFDSLFLQQSDDGARIDTSRFSKGNVALPGGYRADLFVNDSWLGRAEVQLRQAESGGDAHVCFDRALLERVGVDLMKLSPEATARLEQGAEACVTLPSLIADATATFDNGEQRLDISVPQIALARAARGYVAPRYWDEGVTAARLQYSANAYHANSADVSSTQSYVGLNAGINVGAWRFRHNGSLTAGTQTGTHYQSVQTNLQRSIAPLKGQLTVGDAFTDGALFDSVGFRGVQVASDDRMYPESQRGYAPVVRGIANSNARVQVRQNGNLLYETTVAPGAFEIDDLYPTGYGGNLDVVITEADGSVRTSTVPFAAAVNALRPGVTRFSTTIGQYRNPSVESHPVLFQGTLQHGFTNLITGYGGFVMSAGYMAAQVGAALNTRFGAFGLDVTHASTHLDHEPDRRGQSLRLSYSKLVEPTNTNLSVAAYRYSSRGYLGLADAMALRDFDERNMSYAASGIQRGRLQVTVNQSLPARYGSFYVTGSTQNYWDRDGTDTQLQAGYNNSYKRLNYNLAISRQLDTGTGRWDNRVMLTLGIPLGAGAHAPYSSTTLQGGGSSSPTTATQTLSGTLGVDNAFSYGMNASYSHGGGASNNGSVGANAAYTSPLAAVSGSVSRSAHYTQGSVGISGGVVAYSGGVAFTPTMGDTLAIVEAKDAAGARIANGSGLRVDPWGHAIVSSLSPFASNQVEIDPKGLPINVELKSTQQSVAPTAGAVVRLRFDTENAGRAAILGISRADGQPVPFGAEVADAQGQGIGTVAQAGRIIARGLKSDTGRLVVSWGEGAGEQCAAEYALPKMDRKSTAYSVVETVCR
ncbi:fimbria/pilus outer membrane usher protein [Paraburkholderia ginsengisoli]|uniref:Fimbrial biogenesis outer membrane usher protein n=1 Tax=Paraburkholderia ginsengisoli TaxID=311231 RepID=A0A7T4TAV9_9BURK|nr:fimbria/pilus outer membrane usher protein [Paraburkholderia ginsengisoli]QQC66345.1 fimbrial biogenesis outer membrane usher protein [Paraburkholderia ginsengisoli]